MNYKDGSHQYIHLGYCLDLASVHGSYTARDLSPIILYFISVLIFIAMDIYMYMFDCKSVIRQIILSEN